MSTITYQVERWRDLRDEMLPLLVRHWHEVALNHEDVPLDIDEARYRQLDEGGCLHIITVREDGALIGYHVAIVTPHLHYASTLHAITDVYYVAPEKRQGTVGVRLFKAVEDEMQALRKAGGLKVLKLFTGTKIHLDKSALFERLGYRRVEYLYAKLLKD